MQLEPLLRFNLTRQINSKRWLFAIVAFLVIFGAGVIFSEDKYDTFGDGLVVASLIAVNFGIGQDRRSGFELYLSNLVTPGAAVVSRVLAVFFLYITMFAIAFLVATLVWREPTLALWYTVQIFLTLALVVPLSFLLEIVLGVEVPMVLALLLFALFMMYFTMSAPDGELPGRVAFMGLDVEPGRFNSLNRLVRVNLVWNALVVILSTSVWRYQNRGTRIRQPA